MRFHFNSFLMGTNVITGIAALLQGSPGWATANFLVAYLLYLINPNPDMFNIEMEN